MCDVVLVVLVILQCFHSSVGLVSAQYGSWELLLNDSGISTMHAAVTRFNTVIMFDRTNDGSTHINLTGPCRDQPLERILKHDCTAHSVMFDPATNTVRPLFLFTDTLCSSGQFVADGTMVQTGGDNEGNTKIRNLKPCGAGGTCDWIETGVNLTVGRWYSTNHLLKEGNRQIIVGGRTQPTYEFVPKRNHRGGVVYLDLLNVTIDNYYPFVFLLPTGEFYIFAARNSVILNIDMDKVTRKFDPIPDNPRNYPSAGSAVMLPLSSDTMYATVEILICGGAQEGASQAGSSSAPASTSCGRIVPTDVLANWTMEDMPFGRIMGDMINLPDGNVLIINGAQKGIQGWGKAYNPAYNPVYYSPKAALGQRFQVLAATTIARMYHSTANLLSDGRILCAGSNSHEFYFNGGLFPTEFRLEAFSPPYLNDSFSDLKPQITKYSATIKYNQNFTVLFKVVTPISNLTIVEVYQNSAPFVSHSFAQGQRQLKLACSTPVQVGVNIVTPISNLTLSQTWSVMVTAVPQNNIAPPAYYMLFVVRDGIPSKGAWIRQSN